MRKLLKSFAPNMKTTKLKSAIAEGAEQITRLQNRVNETAQERDKSPEHRIVWENACSEFHSRYDALAFPGGYGSAIERILALDPFAIESAICFIEARPYFFRSGYMFSNIMRKIKQVPLSPEQAIRVKAVVERQTLWKKKTV
jgi:hypothetical protein